MRLFDLPQDVILPITQVYHGQSLIHLPRCYRRPSYVSDCRWIGCALASTGCFREQGCQLQRQFACSSEAGCTGTVWLPNAHFSVAQPAPTQVRSIQFQHLDLPTTEPPRGD